MTTIYHTITLFLSVCMLCCSCGGNKVTPDPEPTPVDPVTPTTPDMFGSFDQKWNRYSEGQQHPGQADKNKIVTTWKDTLWLGDRAHKQLVLWTTGKTIRNLNVKVGDLSGSAGTISSSAISVRYGTYVTGDKTAFICGEGSTRQSVRIADALSENAVNSFTAADPLKLWLTIDVPKSVAPGQYTGKIEITRDAEILGSYNMDFLVVNRTLPEPSGWSYHLDIWQFPFQLASLCKVEPFTDAYYTLVKPFYAKLADAGQTAITAYIKDGAFSKGQTMVDWTKTSGGSWQFDYTKFDSYVSEMMALGIDKQINCFSLIGWDTSIGYYDAASKTQKRFSEDVGSTEYVKLWNLFLNSFKSHLEEKGWFSKAVLYLDEVSEAQLQTVVDLVKANDPAWKIGVSGSWYSRNLTAKLYDHSPIITCTDPSDASIKTFYTSCSQKHPNNYVSAENSPSEMIWMSWHALASGYDGYLRWAYDYWTLTDPMSAQDGGNCAGDFHMIYRTSNSASTCKPLSSVRFELLRDGIQDFEKVRIIGKSQFSSVIGLFTTTEPTNATSSVVKAETLLKQLSVTK